MTPPALQDVPAGQEDLRRADNELVTAICQLEVALMDAGIKVPVSCGAPPPRAHPTLHWGLLPKAPKGKGTTTWAFYIHVPDGGYIPLAEVESKLRLLLVERALPRLIASIPSELEWQIAQRKQALANVQAFIAAVEEAVK